MGYSADDQRADRSIDHDRRPCNKGDDIGIPARHRFGSNVVNHAARKPERRIFDVRRRHCRFVGQGDRDFEVAVRRCHIARQRLQIERVLQCAHAKENRGLVVAEVIRLNSAIENRHHAGNSRSAGDADEVPAFLRTKHGTAERTEYGYFRITRSLVEQPIAKPASGFALSDNPVQRRAGSESKLTIE